MFIMSCTNILGNKCWNISRKPLKVFIKYILLNFNLGKHSGVEHANVQLLQRERSKREGKGEGETENDSLPRKKYEMET